MSISWTKKFSAADDARLILTGEHLGTMQDDISAGVTGALPTPGTLDGLKLPRVKSDHSGYELVAQPTLAMGGTGADLSVGTAGYATVLVGTALGYSPLYTEATITFASASDATYSYCVAPVTGILAAAYVCQHVAARTATYTMTNTSAGATMATVTTLTSGVEGAVTTMTLSSATVAVTAGVGIKVARSAQGSAGVSSATLVFIKTP